MDKVTGIQTQILLALARYKFLTVKQIQMLGISDATYTRKLLKTMADRGKPFVKYVAFGVHPKVGKLENMYFLTHFGRDELVKGLGVDGESVRLPKLLPTPVAPPMANVAWLLMGKEFPTS